MSATVSLTLSGVGRIYGSDFRRVLDLARAGAIHVEVERYTIDQAPDAYRKLHDGTIRGRAVVVPGA